MTREQYLKILEDLTYEFEETDFKLFGVDWWAFVRIIVGFQLHRLLIHKIEPTKSEEETNLLLAEVDVSMRDKLSYLKHKILNKQTSQSKIAVFTYNSNKTTLFKDEKINQYTDPFLFYFDKANLKYDLYDNQVIPGHLRIFNKFLKKKLIKQFNKNKTFQLKLKNVSDFLQDKVDDNFVLYQILASAVVENQTKFLVYNTLFSKTKYKKILLYCYYDSTNMAICRAAKENKIETIEYQHSQISTKHFAYSGWSQRIQKSVAFFPDTFWAWRKHDVDLISKGFSWLPKYSAIEGGNMFISLFKNNRPKVLSTQKIKVLITLQGKGLPQFIIDYIHKNNEVLWCVRWHPRYPFDKDLGIELNKQNPDFVEIDITNKLSVLDILSEADYHLTWFSGAAIEAELLGVQNIIFGQEGYETYEKEIVSGNYFFIENEQHLSEIIENRKTNTQNIVTKEYDIVEKIQEVFKLK